MRPSRTRWVGRKAEVLHPLCLEDLSSGGPGERLYLPGREVLIKEYHPKNRANPFSYFTISNLKGKNLVTKVPINVLALVDRPETVTDQIWTFLKGRPDGATYAQMVGHLGIKARTVTDTCGAMMARGILSYFSTHCLGPSKRRPFVVVEISPEGRKTAFERLAGKDIF